MITEQTQVNLALYIGETYCEVEARSESNQVFYKKNIFLPQTSLKNLLLQCKNSLLEKNASVSSIFVVTRYLEKLKTFRLGGSVIQVMLEGHENNYTFQDSTQISLAATNLIITLKKTITPEEVIPYLEQQLIRVHKVNSETDKVVLHLNPSDTAPQVLELINQFFSEKNFKIFKNSSPENLPQVRKTLLNAGTEGTKEELIKEIKEAFPLATPQFWINDSFTAEFENGDLFFSFNDFISQAAFDKKKNLVDKILFLDIENWFVLENKKQKYWKSPWGEIERPHHFSHQLSVHPLTEVFIDQNGWLQFSKTPASSEPGPMIAGRSVKPVVLDLFFNDLQNLTSITEMLPHLNTPLTKNKIFSQFKVMEHGQKTEGFHYNLENLQKFIHDLILFDLGRLNYKLDSKTIYGQLQTILSPEAESPSWTHLIFNHLNTSQVINK